MIKIAFLTNMIGYGGIGRVVSIITKELARNNQFEVYIIHYRPQNERLTYDLEKGIEVSSLNATSTMQKYILCGGVQKLKKLLKEKQIDILVACGDLYFPLAAFSCYKQHCKCICWEHTSGKTTSDHKFQNLCRFIGSKVSGQVLSITKECSQIYSKKFNPDKIFQIYNPIDKAFQDYTGHYNPDSKRIISVGRLTYQKNYPLLIRIAEQILSVFEDWEWHIYGDGEQKELIESMISKTKVRNRLKLMGTTKNIISKYHEYAFLVSTSRYEGFGMVLVEALSCKLPVVSFSVSCGPQEIITDDVNGYLISPFDEDMMKDRIQMLCSSKELRERLSNNSTHNLKQFSLETIYNQWKALIFDLYNN